MNATKTTLCMLLAAAIGSAATATTIWEMQRRDLRYSGASRYEPICSRIESIRSDMPRTPLPAFPHPLPDAPARIGPDDGAVRIEEELTDDAIKSVGDVYYKRDVIEGVRVAFTTNAARDLYYKALSNIVADGPLVAEKGRYVMDSLQESGVYGTLGDGTPVIDYRGAVRLIRYAMERNATGHHDRDGRTAE